MVDAVTLGFALLLLVALGLVAVSGRKVLANPRAPSAPPPSNDGDQHLVAREVVDEQGQRLGETVRIEGGDVVVKAEGSFLVLPKTALQAAGEKLRVLEFNRAQAEAQGEAWRKRQEDVMRYDAQGLPLPDER